MDRLERAVPSGLALLAAALGLAVARRGVSGSDDAWTSVALLVLGASYWTLAGVSAWHACAGVPFEGYLTGEHAWAIELRKWLARILLFPLLVLVPVGTHLRRHLVTRSIGIGPDSDDRVLDVVTEAAGNRLWALTDSAVYVGSPEAAFWRIPVQRHPVRLASSVGTVGANGASRDGCRPSRPAQRTRDFHTPRRPERPGAPGAPSGRSRTPVGAATRHACERPPRAGATNA